jgi:hypothetical protein
MPGFTHHYGQAEITGAWHIKGPVRPEGMPKHIAAMFEEDPTLVQVAIVLDRNGSGAPKGTHVFSRNVD